MRCPFCGTDQDKVIETRASKDGNEVRRRRECERCERRFTTYERIEDALPMVVKNDGRREPFDRNKIEHGIGAAVAKRRVSQEQVKAIALELEKEIGELGVPEIASRDIGERVLPKLRTIDQVAYVRFASIYRDFRDLERFSKELETMRARDGGDATVETEVPPPDEDAAPGVVTDAARQSIDEHYLARCLELAEHGRGRTAPNPIVGCVIVDDRGGVIAEGEHRGPGTPHAEADALAKLGGRAPGATLYCNLEPCNHHGRTPPCAPAVRDAGIARVVIGNLDPIAGHGGGAALLRAAGIEVTEGVLADACARANAPFFTTARLGRPYVVLKAAMSLDGKLATPTGEPRWITGAAARADGHRLRDRNDAILVGIGTVLADDPQLTARGAGQRDPIRVVLDSQLRTPPTAALLPRGAGARTIIACAADAPADREAALAAAGAEILRADPHDVAGVLARLCGAGISSILVEGGGAVHASFLTAGVADELVLYVAPIVIGDPAPSWIGGGAPASLAVAHGFAFAEPPVQLGDDIRLVLTRR